MGIEEIVVVRIHTITAGVNIPWSIKESEKSPQKICFTCTEPVSIVTITPTYCSACFDAWEDGSGNCVYYLPRTTILNYIRASSYKINVKCEDSGSPVTATVNLNVIPNFPPTFDEESGQIISLDTTLKAGSLVKTIAFTDADDTIYTFTLSESPNNGFFRITNTGEIRAIKDLNTFCEEETVEISLSDNHNAPVYFSIRYDPGSNVRPVLKDWNRIINYPENKLVVLYIDDKLADGNGSSCIVRSNPPGLSDLGGDLSMGYCPNGVNARSRVTITNPSKYNFETDPPINLTLQYANGNCPSNTRWLAINWLDVPERPTLEVTKPEYNANEGFVKVKPNYVITDEDLNEKHTFRFTGSVNNNFDIDANTGKIFTKTYLAATSEVDIYTFNVKVADKDGLECLFAVTITIRVADVNDHAPVLGTVPERYQATECNGPQKFLTVTATDDDFGINKKFKFVATTSGSLFINEAGELYLIKPVIPGQQDILNVQAVDRGEPALFSAKKTVTLYGINCPTTPTVPPPPTTPLYVPPPTPPPTTTPTTTTETPQSEGASTMVHFWLLIAVLSLNLLV
ncbi:hypothetical protein LOTGIDRAFT_236784 [Lottia gigantea]|uniref:Cadherin domain-containing protein n=1 Tax=Lottia gigantea TaxID=225164 RepID=V4B435_LOTGI|nr:hypothetical protein LOTGIDRAFT_236784 [Lottia gigantea]ESO83189.1 hypothetical protein LOTGIDRAFT_236784 [Lottia gigantea]